MAPSMISIVDADPELAEQLDDDAARARAPRGADARAAALARRVGRRRRARARRPPPRVPDRRGPAVPRGRRARPPCVELIGPGDVMRPWTWDEAGSHVQAEVGWERARADEARGARPRAGHAHRPVAAARRRAVQPRHAPRAPPRGGARDRPPQRVEDRLLLTLWHLAERWGRVDAATGSSSRCRSATSGSRDIVGAHRPSVTTAMGALAEAGSVSRRDDGDWVLHGEPPEKLRDHRLAGGAHLEVQRLHRPVRGLVQPRPEVHVRARRRRAGRPSCRPARAAGRPCRRRSAAAVARVRQRRRS